MPLKMAVKKNVILCVGVPSINLIAEHLTILACATRKNPSRLDVSVLTLLDGYGKINFIRLQLPPQKYGLA